LKETSTLYEYIGEKYTLRRFVVVTYVLQDLLTISTVGGPRLHVQWCRGLLYGVEQTLANAMRLVYGVDL
jgi:hypothetical protein